MHKNLLIPLAMLAFFASSSIVRAEQRTRVVHVFVALADNKFQGIVPVPARLGNGDDVQQNLYWGAAFGVRTFFKASPDWQFLSCIPTPRNAILQRCIYKYRSANVYLVADGYRGREIRAAIQDFLEAAAGTAHQTTSAQSESGPVQLSISGDSDLVAYVGHDAFMDFQVEPVFASQGTRPREAIVLACASRQYFGSYLKTANIHPLLWTTNLMAPEAYTLKAALDGWIANEPPQKIRELAAAAYGKYQKCTQNAALKLLVTGW